MINMTGRRFHRIFLYKKKRDWSVKSCNAYNVFLNGCVLNIYYHKEDEKVCHPIITSTKIIKLKVNNYTHINFKMEISSKS